MKLTSLSKIILISSISIFVLGSCGQGVPDNQKKNVKGSSKNVNDTIQVNSVKAALLVKDHPLIVNLALLYEFLPDSVKMDSIRQVFNLPNLCSLNLAGNRLFSAPSILRNNKIIFLDLSGNELSNLSDDIGNLPSLRSFFVSKNHLHSLPDALFSIDSLSILRASFNSLTNLPPSIGNAHHLSFLVVDNNHIDLFPLELCQDTLLTYLDFSGNKIEFVPAEIGNLKRLKYLYIPDCDLYKSKEPIPSSFSNLVALVSLDISNNRLTKFPSIIGTMTGLKKLNVSSEGFTQFPEEIFNLKTLEELNISDNSISVLPSDIYKLSSIRKLNLSNNNIAVLPQELFVARNLIEINLKGNPLPPREIERLKFALPKVLIIF